MNRKIALDLILVAVRMTEFGGIIYLFLRMGQAAAKFSYSRLMSR